MTPKITPLWISKLMSLSASIRVAPELKLLVTLRKRMIGVVLVACGERFPGKNNLPDGRSFHTLAPPLIS